MKQKPGPLLKYLTQLEARAVDHEITLQDIIQVLGNEGHFVFILFLILPFLQPIPLYGLSTPFGIIIALAAIFSFLNKPLRLPKAWEKKKLKEETVLKIANGSEKFFKFIGRFLRPRLQFFFTGPFKFINVLIIAVNAILLAMPLPIPFSNAIPAWVIFFQVLGNIEQDGVLILLSYMQAFASFIFFLVLFYGAILGVDFVKYLMK